MKALNDALIQVGIEGIKNGSKLDETTIREVADGLRQPRLNTAYRLALACGFKQEEALTLARECRRVRTAKRAG